MAASQPLDVHELDNTYGVLFIGYIAAMVMYGLTFFRGCFALYSPAYPSDPCIWAETYVYFSRYSRDYLYIKILVHFFSLRL
jgi:hypothetical protein